jgi:hypothetical protein
VGAEELEAITLEMKKKYIKIFHTGSFSTTDIKKLEPINWEVKNY